MPIFVPSIGRHEIIPDVRVPLIRNFEAIDHTARFQDSEHFIDDGFGICSGHFMQNVGKIYEIHRVTVDKVQVFGIGLIKVDVGDVAYCVMSPAESNVRRGQVDLDVFSIKRLVY